MADQQLVLVRCRSVSDNPEITEELNTKKTKKEDMDQLAQAIAKKVLQGLSKLCDNYSQERCKEGSDQLEGQIKALEAFEKLGDKHMRASLADLELIKQPGDNYIQEIQGRREQRGKEHETLVKLATNFSKATSKRMHEAHEERGVMVRLFQLQFNVGTFFLGGVALFLVARYCPRLR